MSHFGLEDSFVYNTFIHYRFQLVFCLGCFGAIMTPGPDSRCRGVRRPGCRLSEEGSDVPCVLLPGQRVLLERSIECVCVMEEADRELILKEINRSVKGIIHESWSRWEGETRGRQLPKEKEACPKETRRTASRKRKVDRGSPPPPEGQCVQIDADANPPGPPGLVNEDESEEASDFQ